jgi:hypothetical protein
MHPSQLGLKNYVSENVLEIAVSKKFGGLFHFNSTLMQHFLQQNELMLLISGADTLYPENRLSNYVNFLFTSKFHQNLFSHQFGNATLEAPVS